jgi:hypothetical protein
MNENQLNRKFEELDFSDEPAMASQPEDDIWRGERRLRRRRTLVVTAGLAAGVVMVTGAVAVLPNALGGDATLQVAGEPAATATASPSPAPTTTPETPSITPSPSVSALADDPFPYPATRQLLLEAAVRHLDPKREHLPEQSTNAQIGGTAVGSKLDWTVRGEDGMGMVKVVVTSPDAESEEYALEGLLADIGCLNEPGGKNACKLQTIPGTSEQAWVGVERPGQDAALSVLYKRADGSYVGIGTYDLFGNSSEIPVSKVDVSLEQAFGFVTDPSLKRVPGDDAKGHMALPK